MVSGGVDHVRRAAACLRLATDHRFEHGRMGAISSQGLHGLIGFSDISSTRR
jgi:hypothetical protein